MQRIIIAFATYLAIAGTAAAGELKMEDFEAATTGSVVNLCSADESSDLGKYAIGFCFGWLEGVEQFYEALLEDERFGVKPISCPESPLTRNESRTAFVEWAKANPDVLPIPPLEGIVRASKELYPCS